MENLATKSFDKEKMQVILAEYKRRFKPELWANEDYKWKAVKTFQDNWNIEATNLADMLAASLKDTDNLLTSAKRYAMGMIVEYATLFPEDVRAMFINLFDESIDVYERINSFIVKSDELLPRWRAIRNKPEGRMHYQNVNAVTTYLWLRYPDKYYIFKYGIVKTVSEKLGSDYTFKKGAHAENVRSFLKFYNEIRDELQKDVEIKSMLSESIDSKCYSDPCLNTLTVDFGYFIGSYYSDEEKPSESDDDFDETDPELFLDNWFPSLDEYTPGFSKEDWLDLLNNQGIIGPIWGGVLAAFYGFGGVATCSQIAQKYNKNPSGISGNCTQLAKSIYKKTGCPLSIRQNGQNRYWPILFQGKKADSGIPGGYMWKLRPELYEALTDFDIMRFEWSVEDETSVDSYSKEDFLKEVYMSEDSYRELVSILEYKKNIILQGAPGVGKTFAAKRLAYSFMGKKDESRIEFIQFHQNYSYEDFVMGYKPNENGFELKDGIFYRFCQKASSHPDQTFFFIIDEINRGNMSKIFGELLMLIENDYRGTKATLAYNGLPFAVPKNLFIIGMMNTADRSLAMIDYALRRRFSFYEMRPGFDTEGFVNYQNNIGNDTFDDLIAQIRELNNAITADKALGKGFCIGHSYFCNIENCNDDLLKSIVNYEIIPMLEEYWFDDETKLKHWSNMLLSVFNE